MAAVQPKEAISLADLNLLASNPPAYPEKPDEYRLDSVTLYIARVPGSRDIILTPSKPSEKNVGLADVESALYIVHLVLPGEDEKPAPTPVQLDATAITPVRSAPAIPIRRKPLPKDARPLTPDSASSSKVNLVAPVPEPVPVPAPVPVSIPVPVPAPVEVPVANGRQRGGSLTSQDSFRPALSSSLATDSNSPTSGTDESSHAPPRIPTGMQAPPVRKPVGPRAMGPSMALPDSLPPPLARSRRFRSHSDASAFNDVRDPLHSYARRSPSPRKNSAASTPPGEPFTLRLVRRQPGSGLQWNAAEITSRQLDPPVQDEEQSLGLFKTSSPPDVVSTSSPPINIDIEHQGYVKFRPLARRRSIEAEMKARAASAAARGLKLPEMMSEREPATVPETVPDTAPDTVSETVPQTVPETAPDTMSDAVPQTVPKRKENEVFSRQLQMSYTKSLMLNIKDKFQKLEEQMNKKGHNRSDSDSSQDLAKEQAAAALGQPGPGMKPRGYTFTSPWGGKCDFRTGLSGRSVSCYHTPYDPENVSYNQLLEEQGVNLPRLSATALSELRFDLPSSGFLVHGDHDGISVGAERAGGGNRGNRAKLGKLIIHHEGLKMIDLLVAANVGVWWGAWERSF